MLKYIITLIFLTISIQNKADAATPSTLTDEIHDFLLNMSDCPIFICLIVHFHNKTFEAKKNEHPRTRDSPTRLYNDIKNFLENIRQSNTNLNAETKVSQALLTVLNAELRRLKLLKRAEAMQGKIAPTRPEELLKKILGTNWNRSEERQMIEKMAKKLEEMIARGNAQALAAMVDVDEFYFGTNFYAGFFNALQRYSARNTAPFPSEQSELPITSSIDSNGGISYPDWSNTEILGLAAFAAIAPGKLEKLKVLITEKIHQQVPQEDLDSYLESYIRLFVKNFHWEEYAHQSLPKTDEDATRYFLHFMASYCDQAIIDELAKLETENLYQIDGRDMSTLDILAYIWSNPVSTADKSLENLVKNMTEDGKGSEAIAAAIVNLSFAHASGPEANKLGLMRQLFLGHLPITTFIAVMRGNDQLYLAEASVEDSAELNPRNLPNSFFKLLSQKDHEISLALNDATSIESHITREINDVSSRIKSKFLELLTAHYRSRQRTAMQSIAVTGGAVADEAVDTAIMLAKLGWWGLRFSANTKKSKEEFSQFLHGLDALANEIYSNPQMLMILLNEAYYADNDHFAGVIIFDVIADKGISVLARGRKTSALNRRINILEDFTKRLHLRIKSPGRTKSELTKIRRMADRLKSSAQPDLGTARKAQNPMLVDRLNDLNDEINKAMQRILEKEIETLMHLDNL